MSEVETMMDAEKGGFDCARILKKAHLNATHYNLKTGCFVNMGNANCVGYIHLALVRNAHSVHLVKQLQQEDAIEILRNTPGEFLGCKDAGEYKVLNDAQAYYSLRSHKYLYVTSQGFFEVCETLGPIQVIDLVFIQDLVNLKHIEQHARPGNPVQ